MSFPLKWVSRSIIIILLLGAFLILPAGVERRPDSSLYLNIYLLDGENEKLLFSEPVKNDQKVTLSYIHSSDLTPVNQVFLVNKNKSLDLHEERYRWYGAGLEFGSGYDITHEDGWIVVSGYNRSFQSLLIRVASTVKQTLTAGSEDILLSDLAPSGSTVLLKIEMLH